MCKKLIYLVSFVLVLGLTLTSPAGADLIGYWPLDEGAGATVADVSGKGHHGFFAEGTPEWVEGKFGKALKFNGSNKVEIPDHPDFHMEDAVSVALWAQPEGDQPDYAKLFCKNKTSEYPYAIQYDTSQRVRPTVYASGRTDGTRLPNFPGEWGHLCMTYDGSTLIMYKDGEEAGRTGASGKLQQNNLSLSIGGRLNYSGHDFVGIIDDVRLYNHALTAEEVQQIMIAVSPALASYPSPAHEATDVPRDVVLGWTPGEFASPINGHKVYLSDNFNDVNDGIGGITHSASSYAPPQRLDLGTTYYWRVDEVNNVNPESPWTGDVWSFTTELVGYPIENITATASSSHQADMGPENTVNGSGLDANALHSIEAADMWLSGNEPLGAWIQYELDKVYKLHEMRIWNSNQAIESLVGFGLKGVTIEHSTNGIDWTTLAGVPEFAQAPGAAGYAHNTTVDLGGTAAKYVKITASSNWGFLPQFGLSEVRFFYIPVWAREPSPDSGATGVEPDVVLSWRAGREAATHDVYISTDEQAVIDGNAPVATVTETSYGPLSLDLAQTYYWKINEVNLAETPTMLEGNLWNLTTREFLIVDDFESYNDLDPDDPESNRIFNVWIDGYGDATNGSLVGYDAAPFAEQTIVHSGEQSMPFFYNNTGGAAYSEAGRTFAAPQNWTKAGAVTLVLYFHGTTGSTGQLYVKINDAKVVYDGDAADIAKPRWKQWNIELAPLGAGVQNVTKLSVGVDGGGATGTLYVDDIRLYRLAPEIVVPSEEIWIEAESAATITAPLQIYDDPAASGGKYIGTDDGIGNENSNPPPDGIATYNFTVAGGTYKISSRINISGGNSFWVQIQGATIPAETELDPSGWVNWNDMPDAGSWFWADVFSDDDDQDATVLFTMPAGTYTLEIARREDGAMLDVIVISKID